VLLVHIGLDLEDEAGELVFLGIDIAVRVGRGIGDGAYLLKASSSSAMPKLLIAEPKNTGVSSPAR
jgi:hypothetical protein